MKKKIFFMLALLCAVAQGAWAVTYDYPEKTKPEFYASYGGKSNVVVINTPAELAYITEHFDEDSGFPVEDDDWSELNYYLNADINMGNSYSWMPLGRESYWVTKYKGTFWGNGHTITYMIRGLNEENQGLFSTIHEDGKVYDVNVVCDIYTQRDFVGGIAGQNYGLIQNCTVNAKIVIEAHQYAGGIVGENLDTGTVTGCRVSGTIKGTIKDGDEISDIGGIAGLNNHDTDGAGHNYYGTIVNCWVEADVISDGASSYDRAELGGICGTSYGIIKYCCVTGDVTSNKVKSHVGGIVGQNDYSVKNCTFYGTLTNYYSDNSKYVGNQTKGSVPNMYDTFDQDEYDAAIAAGHTLYAYAIKNVFAVTDSKTGDGTYTIEDYDAAVSDLTKVLVGHWVKVNVTSGVVSSFSVKDADDNDVEVIRYHQYGDNYYMFPMPRSNVSVTVNFTTQQGDGSEENPYVISTAEDWKAFAKNVNDNHKSYEGEYVMLGGDLEVSTYSSLGTNIGFSNAFKGTFDGNGHTLTCAYAPFTRVMDATIKNLHVTGSSYYGSIVDYSKGTLNLINCRSSVNLDCGAGQGYGGLIRTMVTDATYVESPNANSVTIEGCVFDGSITSTVENEYRATDCSGFVGDAGEGGTVVIRNSLLKPASVGTGILSNTFAKMGNNGTLTIENSYFVATDNLPANQGTQARTVSAGADVTLSGLGEAATTYGSNGITAYAHGISYGGTNYAGGGESVSLTLRHGSKTGYTFGGYTASAGTISGTTLTMPDADVTINAEWTRNTASLADNADNTAFISAHDGDVYDITLTGRTLYKDGAWNTICLPFDLTLEGSPLDGATARTLTEASISGTTLNLTFSDAVTTLVAGTPYIIKWASGDNIVSPVFSGVTIDKTDRSYDNGISGDNRVRFLGTYKSTAFNAEDKSILLMGGENTLYYPTTGAGIGAQRAYFKIGGDGALLARRLTAFNIDFGDDEATGIISTTNYTNDTNSDAWFTLDGRRLSGKPSRAGVYINNGIKVVIK